MKIIVRALALTLAAVLLVALSTAAQEKKEAPAKKPGIKIAALLPGTINDHAFNAAAFHALNAFKKRFNAEVTYQENVPQADFEGAMRDLAQKGYALIWGHGFQFSDAAKKVASAFPKTYFVVTETFMTQPPNMASVQGHFGQLGFITGAAAGLMSTSKTVGVVGAIPIPVITEYMDNFVKGAEHVGAKGLKTYNGSLSDVASGKQAALAQIDQGADVVSGIGNENILGLIQAAKEKGKLAMGMGWDMAPVAPDTIVASAIYGYDVGVGKVVKAIVDGKFEAKNIVQTVGPGGGLRILYNRKLQAKVPKDLREKLAALEKDVVGGKVALVPQPKVEEKK